jgi:hypothetical protein
MFNILLSRSNVIATSALIAVCSPQLRSNPLSFCGKEKDLETPKSKEGLIHATLLKRRAIFLNGSITEDIAKNVVAQLIFLELDQPGW